MTIYHKPGSVSLTRKIYNSDRKVDKSDRFVDSLETHKDDITVLDVGSPVGGRGVCGNYSTELQLLLGS